MTNHSTPAGKLWADLLRELHVSLLTGAGRFKQRSVAFPEKLEMGGQRDALSGEGHCYSTSDSMKTL